MVDAGEKFQVGDLVLVMVNKVEASSVDQIIIEVDAKSPTAISIKITSGNAINRENIQGLLRKSIREPILSALISESMPWHIPAICPHFRERKIRSDLW